MNPYVIAGAFLIGLVTGWTVHGWKDGAERAAGAEASIEEQQVNFGAAIDMLGELGKFHDATDTRARQTITTITERIDADPGFCGLRAADVGLLNALRAGEPLPAPGEPAGRVAAPVAAR